MLCGLTNSSKVGKFKPHRANCNVFSATCKKSKYTGMHLKTSTILQLQSLVAKCYNIFRTEKSYHFLVKLPRKWYLNTNIIQYIQNYKYKYKYIPNLQTSRLLYFSYFTTFRPKLCNSTNLRILFLAVVKYFNLLAQFKC